MSELAGMVAAVTGAGSGIGRAAALGLAKQGASVVCNDVEIDGLQETVRQVTQAGGQVIAAPGDVSRRADIQAFIEQATGVFGGLDVMVANAAVSIYENLESMPEQTLDAIINVNLRGALLCAQAAIQPLRTRGGGSIVLISSVQAYQGLPGCVPYAAAKSGLIAAARTLAVEVGKDRIRVNAVAPGTIDTPMLQRDLAPMNAEQRHDFLQRVMHANALGRIGLADEIADAICYLASARASYVTGACLVVDGGFLSVKAI